MKVDLGILNYSIIIMYLVGMMGVGFYFSKKSGNDINTFFKANGKIPGWAVGISIFATTSSAITFMSIPALAYSTNWTMSFNNFAIAAIIPFVVVFIVPFFRNLNVTSAYEYLEYRFNKKMRLLGSIVFILFHIFRVAIVIYLPTLALESAISINPILIVISIGILSIIYTFWGGVEGVIWGDVIQGILLLLGAMIIILVLLFKISHPIMAIHNAVMIDHKLFSRNNFTLSLTNATIFATFFGGIFNNLYQYIGSQDVVQRYNTTKNINETNKALYLNAKLVIFVTFLFFIMGSLLYIYYLQNPNLIGKSINVDAIVPYFIGTEIPVGLAGLVIAAIFAASQSTISSSLNSISACMTVDIKTSGSHNQIIWAKYTIIIAGIISTLIALYMTITDTSQLQIVFQSLLGLFGGPIAGSFIIGMLSKKVDGNSAFYAVLISVVILYFITKSDIYFMYYGAVGVISSIGLSIILSKLREVTKGIILAKE